MFDFIFKHSSKQNKMLSAYKKTIFLNAFGLSKADENSNLYLYHAFRNDYEIVADWDLLTNIEFIYKRAAEAYEDNAWKDVKKYAVKLDDLTADHTFDSWMNKKYDLLDEYYASRICNYYFYMIILGTKGSQITSGMIDKAWNGLYKICNGVVQKYDWEIDKFLTGSEIEKVSSEDEKKFYATFYSMLGYAGYLLKKNEDLYVTAIENSVRLSPVTAKYHHNLGLCYERKWRTEHNDDYKNKALEQYKKASQCDRHDHKAFNNIGAVILKNMDDNYFNRRIGDKKFCFFNEIEEDWKSQPKDPKLITDLNQEIMDAIANLKIAVNLCGTFEDAHYNLGKAYYYRYLINCCKENNDLLNAYEECNIAKNISPDANGWRYVLRNINELNHIDTAKDINDELLENKAGDSVEWNSAYSQFIHS